MTTLATLKSVSPFTGAEHEIKVEQERDVFVLSVWQKAYGLHTQTRISEQIALEFKRTIEFHNRTRGAK